MHISFFPALGTRTCVPVESTLVQRSNSVRAAFTAYLSPQDYEEAQRTGVRIEVWTNAPSSSRSAGEWGAVTFEEVSELLDAEELEPHFSLDANVGSNVPSLVAAHTTQTHVYHASVSLPRLPGWVYAFTYRLVYPSGVCWLGSDRDNGLLELAVGSAFYEEISPWESRDERRVLVEGQDSEQLVDSDESVVVGKLDVNEWTWTGWATDGSRVWSVSDNRLEHIRDARLAFLSPRASGSSVLPPQTHVFRATSENIIFSITCDGYVFLPSHRQGAVIEYRVHDCSYEDDFERLQNEILSSCRAPHVFHTKNTDTILFTPDYDSDTSVIIYAQPLTCTPTPHRSISLPIDALGSFAKHSTVLSLFNPETRSTLFVDRFGHPGELALRTGTGGARLVVSAVYDLTDNSMPYMNWKFSLPEFSVGPKHVVAPCDVGNPLPTPPASPQAKPQRTVSFVLPSESNVHNALRQRKPVEPSAPAPERNSAARRPLRSDSAFDCFQSSSGSEKIRVVIFNVVRMLARFMGIAVLRFILLVSRLMGGGKQPEVELPQVGSEYDENNAASSSPQVDSKPAEEASGKATLGGPRGAEDGTRSRVEKDEESPSVHKRDTLSTETSGECSMSRTSALSPTLQWVLPARDATPIRLLVQCDAAPENVSKHLTIEVNGEDAEAAGLSALHCVDDKTNIVEVFRPHGLLESTTLLVKLKE